MEINFHEDRKLVDVWVSHADQASQNLQTQLREIYRKYAGEKYTVAVFYSGQQGLAEETSALLCCNKRRSAELEVQRERKRHKSIAR